MIVLADLIASACRDHALPQAVVDALITVESARNTYAWNPEPKYRWFWDIKSNAPFRRVTALEIANQVPPRDFPSAPGTDPDQEWWAQQASWGLMQVMGAVARERGFRGLYLTALTDPVLGIAYGCRHLRWCLDLSRGDTAAALACYNGGPSDNQPGRPLRNADYVRKVVVELWRDPKYQGLAWGGLEAFQV